MHDAVCLANWINVLPSLDIEATEKIFEEYQQERQPIAIENFKKSQVYATGSAKVSRVVVLFFERSVRSMGSLSYLQLPNKTFSFSLPVVLLVDCHGSSDAFYSKKDASLVMVDHLER